MPAKYVHPFIKNLYKLPRPLKTMLALSWDSSAFLFVYLLANSLRRGALWLWIPLNRWQWVAFVLAAGVGIGVMWQQGLYRSVMRYSSGRTLHIIAKAVTLAALILAFALKLASVSSLTIAMIFWGFGLLAVAAPRVLIRIQQDAYRRLLKEKVFVYGAGSAGRQLAGALGAGDHYDPVAFLDDNPELYRQVIQGLPVYSPTQFEGLMQKYECRKVLLAIGRISHSRRAEILDLLEPYPVEVLSIPEFSDIVSGRARIEDLRDIAIEDILGRDPVVPDLDLLHPRTQNKVVMVTGAGGSIGSELCRQIIQLQPNALILFELSEFALYSIEQELRPIADQLQVPLKAYLGNVQDQARLTLVMQTEQVQTVFHAAAYKHVPLVEYNTIEGVKNNVFGTWHAALAARDADVECFVLISTDKAVRPTNTMGASKRMAELCLQGLAKQGGATTYCMVRFGNVLGSSGSVVPLFREQIRQGGPVTVTHPEIIRYFMTIPEAAQLVIQAASMGNSGEVFVLDMGQPVKITDLARRMIHLAGREVKDASHPDGDISIEFSGLRPGEKLFEELLIGSAVKQTHHPRIMAASEKEMAWDDLLEILDQLAKALQAHQPEQLRALLLRAPTDFNPSDSLCDYSLKH